MNTIESLKESNRDSQIMRFKYTTFCLHPIRARHFNKMMLNIIQYFHSLNSLQKHISLVSVLGGLHAVSHTVKQLERIRSKTSSCNKNMNIISNGN